MYRLQSVALLAGLAFLFALVGYYLFGLTGALIVLAVSVIGNALSVRNAHSLVLRLHRARYLEPWEAPDLHRAARALADRAGIPVPALMVYPSDMPNAFALGIRREQPVVATSTALLRLLDRRQLTAVLAHEFAHIKNRDSVLSLASSMFVQLITGVSQAFGMLLLLFLLFGGGSWLPVQGLLPAIVVLLTAPTGAALLQAGLMRTRERLADSDAAALTGDPQALASALYRLHEYGRFLSGWMRRRFRFIYTSGDERGLEWLRTHPTTGERVERLMAMTAAPAAPRRQAPRRVAVPVERLTTRPRLRLMAPGL